MVDDLNRGERLQVMLTEAEVKALDDWRFSRRMPSRAAAVRELLKRGLAADGFAQAHGSTRSQDFGVADGKSRGSDGREQPDGKTDRLDGDGKG